VPDAPPELEPEPVPAAPPLEVPLDAGALAPPELEPVVAPEEVLAEEGADVALVALAELLDVVPVAPVEPVVPVLAETTLVGTVIAGAPDVSAEVEPPPPQAATPSARSPAAGSVRILDLASIGTNLRGRLGTERFHPPAAVRAVV
jgi:hypothetical protein